MPSLPPTQPLQIGDWEHAQQLMRWLRALGLSDFAVFPAVGRALCECSQGGTVPVFTLPMCPRFAGCYACICHIKAANLAALYPEIPAGELIGRELAPVYAAACGTDTPQPGALSVQLPPRLLELLVVAGQHLYHDITGELQLAICRPVRLHEYAMYSGALHS